ncbi:hypothetical protein BGW38_009403 [Lunasporangiospora selenospora]|uniref:Uncharacterized protein n=1 Tax=Lunasporangiospora selenospora TaxID=979761 RepID=A0A9P6KFX7_9FUNG|nr:hypothetical protein BGW38_009403 [Lunasporangiospora selenospora]
MFALRQLTRVAITRPAASLMAARSLSVSAVAKTDIIKSLYLQQLKSYQPAPESKAVDTTQVKDFKAPTIDAAADLAAWEAANVEIADNVAEAAFEEEEEEDVEEEEHH